MSGDDGFRVVLFVFRPSYPFVCPRSSVKLFGLSLRPPNGCPGALSSVRDPRNGSTREWVDGSHGDDDGRGRGISGYPSPSLLPPRLGRGTNLGLGRTLSLPSPLLLQAFL